MTGGTQTKLAAALAWLLGLPVASVAVAQEASPEVLVQAVYRLYGASGGTGLPADVPALSRYLEPALARAYLGQGIDADPIIQGQDWQIGDLVVGHPTGGADGRATVVARFTNFREPRCVSYELARTGTGWRIHDVSACGGIGLRRQLKLDR